MDGPKVDRAAALIGAGLILQPSAGGNLSFTLDYIGRFNADITDQALTARARLRF